jgi:type II secretory pathway component PulF
VAIALLGLLAVMAYWFIGQFEQIFRSFGADVSAPTLAVLRGRFGWFALPVLAGLLTAAGWWRWRPALTPGRVIGTLIGLLVAAAILACLCWYALYLPIFKLGEQV